MSAGADPVLAITGRVMPCRHVGDPDVTSVIVKGDRIAAVTDLRDREDSSAIELLDFGDRVVMPGFIDAHAHVEISCTARRAMVDCRAPTHRSVDDVLQELHDYAARTGGEDWIVGQGNLFFDQKLIDKRLPTRTELDGVSRTRPIALRAGGHTTVINTRALELTGVARYLGRTGMMGGAVVELDENGSPSGVISELDKALGLPTLSRAELKAAIKDGIRDLFTAYGVTSMGEISDTKPGMECMDELLREGGVGGRLSLFLWAPGTMSLAEACAWPDHLDFRSGDRLLNVKGVKLFCDGGYSARNAATRTPYLPAYAIRPGSRGKISLNRRQLVTALERTRDADLQLAVHANGERAQDTTCAAAEAVTGGLPVRIEHAGNLLTERSAVAGWRRAGIVPIPQPVFLYNFGDFFPVYLGPPASRGRFPFRWLLDEGWRISGSSDVHLGAEERQTNPLFSVWCCVARQSFLGDTIESDQAIGVGEALLMHTLYAAEALREEHERGSLEPGKLADIIVLDRDPREVPVDEIPKVNVDYVFVGGRLVHRREGALPPREAVGA